jgi:hypothetical protein
MKDGFPHTINIFFALVLALPHVDVCYDFPPPCLDIQFGQIILANCLFSNVLLGSSPFLLLLLAEILLKLPTSLHFPRLLISPFPFLT